ncbi:unnamed protein product [Mytilus edulis]|uniref:Uncharacterized protein n=1 Tax=Mytilus edulis TaxID=6550 RepID=A0A8S3UHM5_MYTED|nr:unnamed protein product [Mytilus edulis]
MSGSGLKEVLELIYEPNAVTHMLYGKVVSRAGRGFMLVDTALHTLMTNEICGHDVLEEHENEINHFSSIEHPLLTEACEIYEHLQEEKISLQDALESQILQALQELLQKKRNEIKQSRTSKLWLSFLDMVAILKRFLIAERTGDWLLHLSTLKEMLPYLAASGHNLYTKSAYFYLSQMQNLESDHPDIHAHFMNGKHVVRRSDRFWAGLSTDLVIEQVLMRSVKSTGGLTRGRGMGEVQRTLWLLSIPTLAEYNHAMQQLTGTGYKTSDQHIENSKTRMERDNKDSNLLTEFLTERNPFTNDKTLRNIETGMVADSDANADEAKTVGDKIIESIAGNLVSEISFKKKDQIVTLDAKRPSGSNISQQPQVDPQLMFQRLTAVGQDSLNNTAELFEYELSSFPSSLFEANGLPKQAAKATLADAIWNMGDCQAQELPETNIVHVIDGGSLLYRIPWIKGQTFSQICMKYIDHIRKRFSNPTVVMDGYDSSSTKDITHLRRSKGIQSNTITFTRDMPLRVKKETFLLNQSNKQRFVEMLIDTFQEHSIEAIQAKEDADLLIVRTAVEKSTRQEVVIYGEDTDLLILLCHLAEKNAHCIFFTTDKQSAMKNSKVWNIQKTQQVLGEDVCHQLPFVHAITGCDTTSRLHGIGKPAVLKKIKSDRHLQTQGEVFLMESMGKDDVCKAGEKALVYLYGGMSLEGLDILRW